MRTVCPYLLHTVSGDLQTLSETHVDPTLGLWPSGQEPLHTIQHLLHGKGPFTHLCCIGPSVSLLKDFWWSE